MSAPRTTLSRMDKLTDLERKILTFEKTRFRYPGMKERAIRDRFDLSPTAYFQRLNALIERPEALVAEPQLVNRLLRLRQTRRAG